MSQRAKVAGSNPGQGTHRYQPKHASLHGTTDRCFPLSQINTFKIFIFRTPLQRYNLRNHKINSPRHRAEVLPHTVPASMFIDSPRLSVSYKHVRRYVAGSACLPSVSRMSPKHAPVVACRGTAPLRVCAHPTLLRRAAPPSAYRFLCRWPLSSLALCFLCCFQGVASLRNSMTNICTPFFSTDIHFRSPGRGIGARHGRCRRRISVSHAKALPGCCPHEPHGHALPSSPAPGCQGLHLRAQTCHYLPDDTHPAAWDTLSACGFNGHLANE